MLHSLLKHVGQDLPNGGVSKWLLALQLFSLRTVLVYLPHGYPQVIYYPLSHSQHNSLSLSLLLQVPSLIEEIFALLASSSWFHALDYFTKKVFSHILSFSTPPVFLAAFWSNNTAVSQGTPHAHSLTLLQHETTTTHAVAP